MLQRVNLLWILVLVPAMVLPAGAGPNQTISSSLVATDPAQAGPDSAVQGEYVGTAPYKGIDVKYGVQIIALGDGKFHGVGYYGGLPGDGWDNKTKLEADGQTKGNVTVFSRNDSTSTYKDGEVTIVNREGKHLCTFKKVHRKSPTLGAKPPAGAIVLFDGTSADKFSDGRMTPDGRLMEGATSKQKFQSYTIHLEFCLPFEPSKRGQGRGNSGCYAQVRYEVQILDSFGLTPKNNECGAIYGVAVPAIGMSYPPLSWQTYDVDFAAAEYKDGKKVKHARMTVRHNGIEVFKNVEVPHATTAAPVAEGAAPGPVYLQNHGNAVRFRNIWVVEKN
jgi:hypothetical protein